MEVLTSFETNGGSKRRRRPCCRSRISLTEGQVLYPTFYTLIKDLVSQTNKQFLGIAKQIKALDDKVTNLDKAVHDLGGLLVHIFQDTCWIKKYLETKNEEDECEKEKKKENSESDDFESESVDDKAK